MDGALPPALLCAALGLVLASEAKRTIWLGLTVLAITAAIVSIISFPKHLQDVTLWGCWVSVIGSALTVQLPWKRPAWVAIGLAATAGFWAGAIVASIGQPRDLALALPCALIAFPASWLLQTPAKIGVKIIAGWLAAVAILAAAIPLVPTPGYRSDHME
jgi:hypothetical protein